MAALAQPDLQETAIRSALTSFPLPDGIRLHRLKFQNDSTGNPAVYAEYLFTMAGKSDEDRAKDLSFVREHTADAILDLELPVFPYTHFIQG